MKFTQTAIVEMKNRAAYLEEKRNRLVIDADTHVTDMQNLPTDLKQKMDATPNYYHGRPVGAEDLLREMKTADVDMSLIWQNPAATRYTGDKEENFERLMRANRYIYESSQKYPHALIPAGWTDPQALGLDNALKVVDACIFEFGFPVIKMNPAQNAYPITSDQVLAVTEKISDNGAITAFHYGADTEFTPASGLETVARQFPEAQFLAVHMGGGGAGYLEAENMYIETREMGLRNPNIHFIVSAKRDTHFESDFIIFQQAGEPYCNNISCGSDTPYGLMSFNFGGYRALFHSLQDLENHPDSRIRERQVVFTDESIQGYLGGNFAGLIIKAYQKLFSVHTIR